MPNPTTLPQSSHRQIPFRVTPAPAFPSPWRLSKLVEYLPALTVWHVPKAIRVLHDRLVYSPLGAWASYVWQAVVGEMAMLRQLRVEFSTCQRSIPSQALTVNHRLFESYGCFTAIADISIRASFTNRTTCTVARVGFGSGINSRYTLFMASNSLRSAR